MAASQERSRRYELNPRVISPEAVQAVVKDFVGVTDVSLGTLHDKRVKGTSISNVMGAGFQAMRMRDLGFELLVSAEDKERFGINIDLISALGPEGVTDTVDMENYDWLNSMDTMKAFVASAFSEEASMQKLPNPEINPEMIDPSPVKKHQIPDAFATGPGVFLYEWEKLEERWAEENPTLYKATIEFKDRLTNYYYLRLSNRYKSLPKEYLKKIEPEIKSAYDDKLMEYAIWTYAILTPRPPTLFEVANVRPREKS